MQKDSKTRRDFLKATAVAVGFPYIVSSSALGKAGTVAPSNRIAVGVIGTGAQGNGVMGNFLNRPDCQVVAACDVDKARRDWTAKRVDQHYSSTGCDAYNDYRDLLARDDIDAVEIATPDHWHVLTATAAAKAGKDIYMEKPLGKTIEEGQVLRKAINRYGSVFQFGTQQRSSEQFRIASELVRNGAIGELKTINIWAPPSQAGGSLDTAPIPDGLDYDMWLGPAPYRQHSKNRCASDGANKHWWFNTDYCIGWISGWGIHPIDIALWGASDKLTGPIELQGTGDIKVRGLCDTAIAWNVKLKYESGVKIDFRGSPPPAKWKKRYIRATDHGTVFEGTEGWVHVDRQSVYASSQSILDAAKGKDFAQLYKSRNHVGNFLDCIKTRAKTICTVEDAFAADLLCHISDIAIRTGRKLKWDTQKEIFIGDAGANGRLKKTMRTPWTL